MWRLDGDEAALRASWLAATPFGFLIFDDVLAATAFPDLFGVLDEEPVERYQGDIFAFDASAPVPVTAAMRDLRDRFGELLAPVLSRITGKPLVRADMRAYAYRPGHYLLPHSDHQAGLERALAFAYYIPSPDPPIGGELEMFACELEHGELVSTVSARVIDPRDNRLVVFDVSDRSLHQVREVLGGLRISLAGWFYS